MSAAGPALCRGCGRVRADPAAACCDAPQVIHSEMSALTVAHVDCDAFFAAIEKRDDPRLAAQPVIIGGGRRGVVATACYVARAYGVRSAMPMFKALRRCPNAVVIKPDLKRYAAEGRAIRAMMEDLTPAVQPVSIDEAYLDLHGLEALHAAPPASVLARFQAKVEDERGLTVSVGLSYNKLLAKMASDLDKPRGFAVIGRADALAFLDARPVGAFPGVGPAAERALGRLGVRTGADLRRIGETSLTRALGDWGRRLHAFAHGEDSRPVDPASERKSVSAETTFSEDLSDPQALADRLWLACERVCERARAAGVAGSTVTLKLKDAGFNSRTRRRALPAPTQLAARVFEAAAPLLATEATGRTAFRLIGVGLSDLTEAAGADQGDLMDPKTPKRAAAARAAAAARERFGETAVVSGRTVKIMSHRKPGDSG